MRFVFFFIQFEKEEEEEKKMFGIYWMFDGLELTRN